MQSGRPPLSRRQSWRPNDRWKLRFLGNVRIHHCPDRRRRASLRYRWLRNIERQRLRDGGINDNQECPALPLTFVTTEDAPMVSAFECFLKAAHCRELEAGLPIPLIAT